tara:strand:+ start:759 stop:1622 length:864 start_codon:yes stop_codon:yes gene_type:complete
MKNSFNRFFSYLDDEKVQLKLKRFNVGVALISFIYIYQLIKENLFISNFNFQINYLEMSILILVHSIAGINWVKFSSRNLTIVNRDVFFDWAYSNIGKYIPGGFGVASIRLNQSSKEKNSKKILFGLLEEQFLAPILSVPVLVISFYFVDKKNVILSIILLQVIFLLLFKKLYFLNDKLKKASLLNQSHYLLGRILLNNLLIIFIFYNLGFEDYLYQSLYYLIASYAGQLFIGVPSGIGIREGIYFLLSNASFNFSEQLDALIYIRLLYLIVDVFFGLIGFIYKNKS